MFEDIWDGIAVARGRDLSVGAAGLGPAVLELGRIVNAIQALYSEYFAAFDAAQGYADEQLTAAAWLRTRTNLSRAEAAAQARVAKLRTLLPELASAFDSGVVSFAHLQAVQPSLRLLPEELIAEVDRALAEVAPELSARDLGRWVSDLAQALQPTPKPKDETRHESRRLSLTQGFDGMTNVVGRLTPEVAEKFRAGLSAASRPDAEGEIRAANQRHADALEHLLDSRLDTAMLPVDGGEKPHISQLVDLDQISEAAQHTEDEQQLDLDPATSPYRAGPLGGADQEADAARRVAAAIAEATSPKPRFSWTGNTSVGTARRLCCDAILLPIYTRNGEPLDVGRRTRLISAALRAFIVARDIHCRWPGCTIPARWTQIHHTAHWRDGGRTDRANLILICQPHHRAAHSGRYTITLEQPGIITVQPRHTPTDPYYTIRAGTPPGQRQPPDPDQPSTTGKLHAAARQFATTG